MSMSRIKIPKPIIFAIFANFGFIREPFIFSINKKKSLPPSNAGNGSKFIIAKFIEIRAAKDSRYTKPNS